MNRSISNSSINYRRGFLTLATMLFVLLTSCPVKSSIKTWAGLPANTEQGLAKGNRAFTNSPEKCAAIETGQAKTTSIPFLKVNDALPVITCTFLLLPGIAGTETPTHPLYGNVKIPGNLPLFLHYRKLVI